MNTGPLGVLVFDTFGLWGGDCGSAVFWCIEITFFVYALESYYNFFFVVFFFYLDIFHNLA